MSHAAARALLNDMNLAPKRRVAALAATRSSIVRYPKE